MINNIISTLHEKEEKKYQITVVKLDGLLTATWENAVQKNNTIQ